MGVLLMLPSHKDDNLNHLIKITYIKFKINAAHSQNGFLSVIVHHKTEGIQDILFDAGKSLHSFTQFLTDWNAFTIHGKPISMRPGIQLYFT